MTRMTANLAKFRALSRAQRWIVLEAAFLLPFFWIGLQLFGLRRLQAWLGRSAASAGTRFSLEEAKGMGNLVNIAGRHVPCPVTCLTRSLLLDWMLRRRRVASRLRIGVRVARGVLDAHAWIEVDGVPVNDQPDIGEQFKPFTDIPPSGTFHSP